MTNNERNILFNSLKATSHLSTALIELFKNLDVETINLANLEVIKCTESIDRCLDLMAIEWSKNE